MRYGELIDQYCLSLAAEGPVALDKSLIHLVQLQRVAEDMSNVFGYETPKHQPPSMKLEGIVLLIEAFKARLDSLRSLLPLDVSSSCKFKYIPNSWSAVTRQG